MITVNILHIRVLPPRARDFRADRRLKTVVAELKTGHSSPAEREAKGRCGRAAEDGLAYSGIAKGLRHTARKLPGSELSRAFNAT